MKPGERSRCRSKAALCQLTIDSIHLRDLVSIIKGRSILDVH